MKRFLKILALVVVVVLAIICAKRWNVWFGNPVEPAYTGLQAPSRIQLTFGNDGEHSRNISWQCGDTLLPSSVVYFEKEKNDTLIINAVGKIFHTTGGTTVSYHTALNDLKKGNYQYSVRTGDKQSAWYDFAISENNDDFSFIYLGDIQDTVGGVMKNVVRDIRHWQPSADFWLLGGDVIERPHDRYWNEYFCAMDSLSQTLPILAIAGNHEYLKGITRRLEERFIYTFSYFLNNKDFAAYDLRYGDTHIILLDSNRDFWQLPAQREWLKAALQRAGTAQWKIVALHHPVYSVRGKTNNLTVRWAFNDLFQEYGVDLVLQGHEHNYARRSPRTSAVRQAHHTASLSEPLYVISNSSPKNYKLKYKKYYEYFGNNGRFFSTIRIHRDSLFFKTFTENNELYDEVLLLKK